MIEIGIKVLEDDWNERWATVRQGTTRMSTSYMEILKKKKRPDFSAWYYQIIFGDTFVTCIVGLWRE
jgi:hypothetical protein